MKYIIDKMTDDDREQAYAVYLECMSESSLSVQPQTFDLEKWNSFNFRDCRLVAKEVNNVIGWATLDRLLSPHIVSDVAEVSIYVKNIYQKQCIGSALLAALIKISENLGIFVLQSTILKENKASKALHKRCGFREVKQREGIAQIIFWYQPII